MVLKIAVTLELEVKGLLKLLVGMTSGFGVLGGAQASRDGKMLNLELGEAKVG